MEVVSLDIVVIHVIVAAAGKRLTHFKFKFYNLTLIFLSWGFGVLGWSGVPDRLQRGSVAGCLAGRVALSRAQRAAGLAQYVARLAFRRRRAGRVSAAVAQRAARLSGLAVFIQGDGAGAKHTGAAGCRRAGAPDD